jgi:cell shape-determining protein MreC
MTNYDKKRKKIDPEYKLWKNVRTRVSNYLKLENINKYEALKVGFHIVTSPYSKNFPENVPIGIIESLKSRTTETFYDIKVKSAVNFGKIQTVYIVIDLFKDEIEKLEAELNKKNLNVK